MKALILATVMALGGTGASALDTNTLLTKGTVIAENQGHPNFRRVWVSYKGEIYSCQDGKKGDIDCIKRNNTTVK